VRYVLERPHLIIWGLRKYLAPNLVLPVKLPSGQTWLARNDFLGSHTFCGTGFENNEQLFIKNLLKPGMTVLDIGAHHGFYTLMASHLVGNTGKVISFEPSPREMERLQKHLEINKCTNVEVISFALGSSEGQAELHVCPSRDAGLNSLRQPSVDIAIQKITVRLATLDTVIEEKHLDTIDFIKIDVEGGELEVFKGAKRLLSRTSKRPLILYEIQDVRTKAWGYKAKEAYDFLAEHNYQSCSVNEQGKLVPFPPLDEYDHNLVAVPNEQLANFIN
jgi:FkbM family methyltransferase